MASITVAQTTNPVTGDVIATSVAEHATGGCVHYWNDGSETTRGSKVITLRLQN